MISLRYHIVTIVAVFLALALGLLGGSAFVQPALQRDLERRTDDLRRTVDELRDDVARAEARATAMEAYADAARAHLTTDRLIGTPVVIVSHAGIEEGVLGEAQLALLEAGAEIVAVMTAQDAIASTDESAQGELAAILEMPDDETVEPAEVATALAERLATAVPEGADPASDVLDGLLSAGFVTTSDATALDEVGGPGQVVLVLGGGASEEPALDPAAFGATLVEALVDADVDVAAGEGTGTPDAASFVGVVRDRVGDAVVSVDDLDLSMGGAALVLGIAQLRDTGDGGSYGIDGGAEPLPPAA